MINRKKEQRYSNMLTVKEYLTEGVAVGRMMQGHSISWGEAYEAGLKAKVKYDPKVCFILFKKRGGEHGEKKKNWKEIKPTVADGFPRGKFLFSFSVSKLSTVSMSDFPLENEQACTCACKRRQETRTMLPEQSETPMYSFLYGARKLGQGVWTEMPLGSTFSHRASTVPAWIIATCSSFLKF